MSTYIASPELKNAVSVAYKMSMPLLLTGEPGCGKTQCAYWMQQDAYKNVFTKVLRYDVKTTSSARDLFYRYDAIRHFRDAQKKDVNVLDYIHFTALGQAILATSNGQRCVVLIDEIDKAPRDFPNDLLYEIENLKFRIEEATLTDIQDYKKWGDKLELKELGITKPAFDDDGVFQCLDAEKRPFLLLTSNSEKNLPDAFMRRCAYFHLIFPERKTLEDILVAKKLEFPTADIKDGLLNTFIKIRETQGLRKNPGIAEMLNWLHYLSSLDTQTKEDIKQAALLLAKNKEDNTQLLKFIDSLA